MRKFLIGEWNYGTDYGNPFTSVWQKLSGRNLYSTILWCLHFELCGYWKLTKNQWTTNSPWKEHFSIELPMWDSSNETERSFLVAYFIQSFCDGYILIHLRMLVGFWPKICDYEGFARNQRTKLLPKRNISHIEPPKWNSSLLYTF